MNNNNAIIIDTRIRYIRVSAKWKARVEEMRVKRNRQVKAERRAAEEEAARMEADRKAAAIKAETQVTAVELSFQILDWLQIAFRLISDW